jgi:hypothetical protein
VNNTDVCYCCVAQDAEGVALLREFMFECKLLLPTIDECVMSTVDRLAALGEAAFFIRWG